MSVSDKKNLFVFNRTFAGKSALDMIRTSDHNWTSSFLGSLPISNGFAHHNGDTAVVRSSTPEDLDEGVAELSLNNKSSPASPERDSRGPSVPPPPLAATAASVSLSARASSPVPPVITDERLNLLWPPPSVVRQLAGEPIVFPKDMQLTVSTGGTDIHK